MPAAYDKLGVRFQYPDNWTLETDAVSEERQTISVYSPGGAFWTVMCHSPDADLEELARTALVAMENEYEDLDSEAIQEQIGDVEVQGFDLNFYCLDLTNTAWIRVGSGKKASYLVICQAEDLEFVEVSGVFRAMTASLFSGIAERP
jgi:hypothetical protein